MKKHNGYERKDEGDEPSGVAEVKAALKAANEAQHKEWAALTKKLDEEHKKSDGVLKDEIKKLNELMATSAEEQKTKNAELHAVINRLNQQGTKANGEDVKSARTRVSLNALRNYAQKGITNISDEEAKAFAADYPGMTADQIKAMASDSGPRGGFMIPADTSGRIVKRIYETSVMGQLANVQQTNGPILEGVRDEDEAEALMVGERAARTETDTPDVGKWSIPVHECYAFPKLTQTEIDDAGLDIEAWLMGKVTDRFARKREDQFINGLGRTGPRGLITYTERATTTVKGTHLNGYMNVVKSGVNGGITDADPLVMIMYNLKKPYRLNATWLLPRDGIETVKVIKQDGKYIWAPSVLNIDGQLRLGSGDGTLFGYNIGECNDLPTWGATGAIGAVFGDIKETYQIAERQGMRTIRDDLTAKPYVGLYTTIRFGGDVLNFESFTALKLSA